MINIIVFIVFVNLPFISITQIIGFDIFFDSFENPTSYQYFKNNLADDFPINYCVMQKSSHPDFLISKNDKIIYINEDGEILCKTISNINYKNSNTNFYKIKFDENLDSINIKDYQIIGKIVNDIDDNIWNKLSLKVWDASINNLNVAALFMEE